VHDGGDSYRSRVVTCIRGGSHQGCVRWGSITSADSAGALTLCTRARQRAAVLVAPHPYGAAPETRLLLRHVELTGDLDQIPRVVAALLSTWLESNKHVNEWRPHPRVKKEHASRKAAVKHDTVRMRPPRRRARVSAA
jgi:hypothetical protein